MAQINKDTLWKGMIEELFEEFCGYFFPEWARNVADFSQKPEFLDKELHNLLPEADQHLRRADTLVHVPTKNGQEQWILIHIEVQGYEGKYFAERMFTYFYRIRDRHPGKNLMSLALYTDDRKGFRPTKYQYRYEKTKLTYEFQTFKLLSKTDAELTVPGNPFSILMRTAKKALEKKKHSDAEQLVWKSELVRELGKEGYSSATIRNPLYFIRNYVRFTKEQTDQQFIENISQILNIRQSMGLIERLIEDTRTTSFMEGREEGIEIGEEKGIHLTKLKGIRKALQVGRLTIPEIADLFEVSEEFVRSVEKGEV